MTRSPALLAALVLVFVAFILLVEPVIHGLTACETRENPHCPFGETQ